MSAIFQPFRLPSAPRQTGESAQFARYHHCSSSFQMTSIPLWHPGLSVLNPQLDAQHITLIEVGLELVRVNGSGRGTNEQILHLLRDLSSILMTHHALEEAVLEKNGCPTLNEIKTFHVTARAMLDQLIEDARNHSIDRLVLPCVIAEWMSSHLIHIDMPVKKYLKE